MLADQAGLLVLRDRIGQPARADEFSQPRFPFYCGELDEVARRSLRERWQAPLRGLDTQGRTVVDWLPRWDAHLLALVRRAMPGTRIVIVERDQARARKIASMLPDTMVTWGDGLDAEILEEINIRSADTVVAVTDDDETNILGSLLAKRYGVERTIALANKTTYSSLVTTLGIDVLVNPRAITVSTILQHIRRGRIRAVHSLRDGFGEIIEAEALETSPLVGSQIREGKLPSGVIIGAIVRDGEVIIPRGDTDVRARDRVILLATSGSVKKVEKLFAVRLEFF